MGLAGYVHVLLACTLGVCIHHLVFIHGEWHLKVPQILFGHVLSFLALCVVFSSVRHDCSAGFYSSLQVGATYIFSLLLSMIIYRAYYHRIRAFPGPRLAAVTKLWHVWQCRNSTNFLVMQRMHEDYGEVVRTGGT